MRHQRAKYYYSTCLNQSLCPFPPGLVCRTCLFRNPTGFPILPKFESAIPERGVRQPQDDTLRGVFFVIIQYNPLPNTWFTTNPDLNQRIGRVPVNVKIADCVVVDVGRIREITSGATLPPDCFSFACRRLEFAYSPCWRGCLFALRATGYTVSENGFKCKRPTNLAPVRTRDGRPAGPGLASTLKTESFVQTDGGKGDETNPSPRPWFI